VQSRPKRSSTEEGRVLAWGRLYIAADAVRRVEEEARRRGGSPSGLLAEIIERWARHGDDATEEDHPREDGQHGAGDGSPMASSGSRG